MRFILVNGRTPVRPTFCLQCCEKIGDGYLRAIRTRLPYCDYQCYARQRDDGSLTSETGRSMRANARD
jgi:hypothetical protein